MRSHKALSEKRAGGMNIGEDGCEMANAMEPMSAQLFWSMARTGEKPVLLDIRDEDAYEEGHLPGAVCIPGRMLKERVDLVLHQKDRPVAVYAQSGWRSKEAAQALTEMGYACVWDLGSMHRWTHALM